MTTSEDDATYAEIDAILDPIKARFPGLTNGEVATYLPEHLRQPFWARAIERYLGAKLADIEENK